MKKTVFGVCVFLTLASVGLFAESKRPTSNLRKIECQIIPNDPMSKSRIAYSSFAKKMSQRMSAQVTQSLNWSGYAAYTSANNPEIGSVSDVWGNWRVPKLKPSPNTRYSACWVGIDGFSNQTVEQIGTLQLWDNGQQVNFAWFSLYPGPTYEIFGFPVNPCDTIRAQVSYIGNNGFELILENLTQGVYTAIPTSFTEEDNTQRNSAEWIVEAPSLDPEILPLAHFTPVTFSHCLATIRGKTQAINGSNRDYSKIFMVTTGGKKAKVKAKPSSLCHDGKSFTIKWEHQ